LSNDQTRTCRPRGEQRLVVGWVILICLVMAHAVYYGYSADYAASFHPFEGMTPAQYAERQFTKPLTVEHPIFEGHDFAPNQYRIGVVYVARFLVNLVHIRKLYGAYALIDFVCAVFVCYCLYLLLGRSGFLLKTPRSHQLSLVALLLAAFCFPLSWVSWWGRPETLPSALYVTLILVLIGKVRNQPRWFVAILALTLWQDFVRTDIPGVLGVAILILSFGSYGVELFGSKRLGLLCGGSIASLSAAVHYVLKHVIYPYATYPPDTPAIVFFYNFTGVRSAPTILIALLPYGILLMVAARHWRRLDPEDILALIASVIYLPLWCTFGFLGEVRIFVPFLLALTPALAKLMYLLASPEPQREEEASVLKSPAAHLEERTV
jgi:hypothetical protein